MNTKAKTPASTNIEESNELTDKLDTVRDILFGAQVRETKEKSKALERLVETTADRLQKDFDKQIKRIEDNIAKMKEALAKQAKDTAADVSRRFDEAHAEINALDESSTASRNEMHEELSTEIEALESRASSWNEDLAKQLEQIHQELLNSKTDRVSLATMFLGMAESLAPEASAKKKK